MVGRRRGNAVKEVSKTTTKVFGTKSTAAEKYVVEKVVDKRFVHIVLNCKPNLTSHYK
jgi:hypothetical protein